VRKDVPWAVFTCEEVRDAPHRKRSEKKLEIPSIHQVGPAKQRMGRRPIRCEYR